MILITSGGHVEIPITIQVSIQLAKFRMSPGVFFAFRRLHDSMQDWISVVLYFYRLDSLVDRRKDWTKSSDDIRCPLTVTDDSLASRKRNSNTTTSIREI